MANNTMFGILDKYRKESCWKDDQYIYSVTDLAFYNTGITPQYGDKLITLSTCEYTLDNGRRVVVAYLVA